MNAGNATLHQPFHLGTRQIGLTQVRISCAAHMLRSIHAASPRQLHPSVRPPNLRRPTVRLSEQTFSEPPKGAN